MATKIISIIVSCLCVISLISYSFVYFHFEVKSKTNKIVLFSFFIISAAVAVLSCIFIAIHKDFKSGYDSEILMNIESAFLLVLSLMGVSTAISLFTKKGKDAITRNNRLYKITVIDGIITKVLYYIVGTFIFVLWLVITIIGNYIKAREDVVTYLTGTFSFITYIFLALFIILSIAMVINITLKIIFSLKQKTNIYYWIKSAVCYVGYIFIILCCLLIFLGLINVDNMHNWFGRSLLSFIVEVYTNDFSYMLLYFDIIGISFISISFVRPNDKILEVNKN